MLEMKITITAADLAAAINNLAAAINTAETKPETLAATSNPTQQAAVQVDPMTTPAVIPNVTPAIIAPTASPAKTVPLNTTPAQPVSNTAPIPTAAPQYTLEMISTAGSSLIDSGKMQELVALLQEFGVNSLFELKPDVYGAVANRLRALGAQI